MNHRGRIRFLFGLVLVMAPVSAGATDLLCNGVDAPHASVRQVIIRNAHRILEPGLPGYGARLEGLDAVQRDPSVVESGVLQVSMHNGCDNFFLFDFPSAQLKSLLLGGGGGPILGALEYSFPGFPEDLVTEETEFMAAGRTPVRCDVLTSQAANGV